MFEKRLQQNEFCRRGVGGLANEAVESYSVLKVHIISNDFPLKQIFFRVLSLKSYEK
jgi:hypothetical protein